MKFKIQNPKPQIISKFKYQKTYFEFWILVFIFIWDFVLGTWDFRSRGHANGYAALTTTILVVVVALAVIAGFAFFALQEVRVTRNFTRSIDARYVSEAGIEDGIYRVLSGKQLVTGELLGVGKGTTTIVYTISGQTRTIRSEGKREAFQQNLETRLDITVAATNFFYGAQVGDLGLTMMNNSSVVGSVYSDGDIIGSPGATITSDALVAVGTPSTVNQSWEVQNTDVAVGRVTGSIITIVDSVGDVGEYTSLKLGSDGLARVSYIDGTNGDLKFARCTNDDCTSRVLTTVDSAPYVNEVTSLVLGSDGFGRISYYDDGNDDLEFARCTNADCTGSVLETIESSQNVGDFSDMELGSDGFPRIAYWQDSKGDVKFARCTSEDCSGQVVRTTVDSGGTVGEYISLELGSDGFARMSYYDRSNGDLVFTRCSDADCSSSVRTVVDSAGTVGEYTSLKLGADGLARISYFDNSNGDLKFARCLDADCSARNISVADSDGTVGHYTSLAFGSDDLPRISYYDSSNGDLKFARCTNVDCSSVSLSRVDDSSSAGKHNSLEIASDGFGRISYYAGGGNDLRYVRCTADPCPPSDPQLDAAQGFRPSVTERIARVELFLKKVGTPSNATVRIIRSSGSVPSTDPADVLATGTLNASSVSSGYSWVGVSLTSTPTLTAETTYWIVVDVGIDNNNYFVWGGDSGEGYGRGSAKESSDWTVGGWTDLDVDFDFRAYMGGTDRMLRDVTVNGNAHAHVIDNTSNRTIGGNADGWTLNNITVGLNVDANAISNCIITGNAAYNSMSGCTILGSQTTPNTPPADPPQIPLPISQSTIDTWKNEAASGGTWSGDYDPAQCSVSLGPKKITGNIILDASCPGGQTLTVTGTIWVQGNIDVSNNAKIVLASGYGDQSGVVMADGWIHISNNGEFGGSGTAGSYLMLFSTATGGGHHGSAIDLHNNATGAIFYAQNGLIWLHNNVEVTEVVGRGLHLDQNATLIYEIGLQNVKFSSGPGGGYDVKYWKEVE